MFLAQSRRAAEGRKEKQEARKQESGRTRDNILFSNCLDRIAVSSRLIQIEGTGTGSALLPNDMEINSRRRSGGLPIRRLPLFAIFCIFAPLRQISLLMQGIVRPSRAEIGLFMIGESAYIPADSSLSYPDSS